MRPNFWNRDKKLPAVQLECTSSSSRVHVGDSIFCSRRPIMSKICYKGFMSGLVPGHSNVAFASYRRGSHFATVKLSSLTPICTDLSASRCFRVKYNNRFEDVLRASFSCKCVPYDRSLESVSAMVTRPSLYSCKMNPRPFKIEISGLYSSLIL